MIFHFISSALCTFFGTLYALLPPWTVSLGMGCVNDVCAPSSDNNGVYMAFHVVALLDKFLPIHDAMLPMLLLSTTVFAAMWIIKFIKFVLSLIPTISAGG